MERILQATAEKGVSKYGVNFIRRTRGAAMGTIISPVKAEIVFSDEGKGRRQRHRALEREGFLLEGEDLNQVINGVRYVDDLVLMSKLVCVE